MSTLVRLEATCGQKGGIWRRKILTAFEKMGAELVFLILGGYSLL